MSGQDTAGEPIARRALAWTFLRAGLIAASLVTLYYALPINGRFSHAGYVLLPVGLVVFGLVTRRELCLLPHAAISQGRSPSISTGRTRSISR